MATNTDTRVLESRETSTILAALRLWQTQTHVKLQFEEIATNDGADEPLDDDEIDALCEEINCGTVTVS